MKQHAPYQIRRIQLELSEVHEGETVAVLSEGPERLDYADAFIQAAQDLGARAFHLRLPQLPPTGAWRVEVGGELLSQAKTMRITNEWGTDITYQLGTYPTVMEYGYTDEPGCWGHWPSGFVFSGGADDGVDGQIVLAPGDVILPFNRYAQFPVTYTIEQGRIQDIRGGLDAELIKAYMKSFDDPDGFGMSHAGWRLDERANWHGLTQFPGGMGMELRSFFSNVMFSTGPNNELGDPNSSPCHLDIPMRNCSLFLMMNRSSLMEISSSLRCGLQTHPHLTTNRKTDEGHQPKRHQYPYH